MADEGSRGGPKTAEGRQIALANLRHPPELAPLTHQGDRFLSRALAPSCRMCVVREECEAYVDGGTCRLAEEAQAEVYAHVMALPHIRPEDEWLAREFAKWSTWASIVDRYLSARSPFLPGADGGYVEAQPVLKQRMAAAQTLVRLASELGLSPAARKRLQSDVDRGAAARIAAVFVEASRQEKAARRDVLEGEFEEVDSGE